MRSNREVAEWKWLLPYLFYVDIMHQVKTIIIKGFVMSFKIQKIALLLLSLNLQACTTCDIANLFGDDICNIVAVEQVSEFQTV